MPSNEEHSKHTHRKYGLRASDLHEWMDEPSRKMGSNHRKYRHDPDYPPEWAVKKYGFELARKIMQDHVELDHRFSGEVYLKKDGLTLVVKGIPLEERAKFTETIKKWLKEEHEMVEKEDNSSINRFQISVLGLFVLILIIYLLFIGATAGI